jgi:YegS/Rv2252/BmrU family lipid kinase
MRGHGRPVTTLILNLGSRRSAADGDRLQAALRERQVIVDDVLVAQTGSEVRAFARRAVKRGSKLIIAAGGDGTMTTVVGELAFRDVTLGVVPLGTGNSFAQSLGIALDVDAAVEVIAAGHCAQVDLGKTGRTYFANFATIGLPAEIARQTPRSLKSFLGTIAYVIAGLGPAIRQGAFACDLRWERNRTRLTTKQIVIASGRVYGNTPLAPEASITDGKLTIFTATGLSHAEVARVYAALALGRQDDLPDAFRFSARSVRVRTWPRQAVSLDGEAWGKTPVQFAVASKALRVLVPADFHVDT